MATKRKPRRAATKRPRRGSHFHLSKSADWGSPRPVIDLGRSILGGFDLDAASSGKWNTVIGASEFFDGTEGRNLIAGDPLPKGTRRVLCNPPGDESGELVRAFWFRLVELWVQRVIDSLYWVGFSLEQFLSLQKLPDGSPSPWPSPLSCCAATLIGRRRWRYLQMVDDKAVEGCKPTHGSYVTLLPSHDAEERRDQLAIMRAAGKRLGELIIRPSNDGDVDEAPVRGPLELAAEAAGARVAMERRAAARRRAA